MFSGSNKLHYIWASALDIDRDCYHLPCMFATQKHLYIDLYTAAVLRDNEVRNTIPSAETHKNIKVYIPKLRLLCGGKNPAVRSLKREYSELRQSDVNILESKSVVAKSFGK